MMVEQMMLILHVTLNFHWEFQMQAQQDLLRMPNEQVFGLLNPDILALPLEVTGIPHFKLDWWYLGGQKRQQWLHEVALYWRYFGFVSVEDQRIEQSLLWKAYEAAEKFFELPDDVKNKYIRNLENGFTKRGGEGAAGAIVRDDKEFYHIHAEHWEDDVFPEEVEEFETALRAWFAVMRNQAEVMLTVAAYAMGIPAELLINQLNTMQTVMRILHYFNDGKHQDWPLSGKHEDINWITGLPPSVGRGKDKGLWCTDPSGVRVYVPNIEGLFRIIWNLGNMAALRFHGIFRDVTHGVDRGTTLSRNSYSMPFFVHMGREFPLVTVQTLQDGIEYLTGKSVQLFGGQAGQNDVIMSKGRFFDWRIEQIDTELGETDCSAKHPEEMRLSQLRTHLEVDLQLTSDEVNKLPLFGRGFFPENFPVGLSPRVLRSSQAY